MVSLFESIVSDASYFKQLSVKGLFFVHAQHLQAAHWTDLWPHYNYLVYTVGGQQLLQSPEQSLLLQEGDLVLLRKDNYYGEQYDNTPWEVLVCCIPDYYLKRLYRECRQQVPADILPPLMKESILHLCTNDTTKAFFFSLMPYFGQQAPVPENLLELKFRELVYIILSNIDNINLLSWVNGLCDEALPSLSEMMENNYIFNLSLAEYAKICRRSLTVFKKEFAAIYATTPGKWLLVKRLNYARLLLQISRKRINEIVTESGFESTTHFSRAFKQRFGLSPLQYRKQSL